jgi:prevent-host-death family protein
MEAPLTDRAARHTDALDTVTATEANRSFSAVLRRARLGEVIAITDRGRIVARLVPEVAADSSDDAQRAHKAAWQKVEARLRSQPALKLGSFNRDWAYDD